MHSKSRLVLSLAIFILWIATTIVGGDLLSDPDSGMLGLVSKGIGWHFVAAIAVLLVAILVFGWNDTGLRRPQPGWVRTVWFSLLYLALLGAISFFVGWPTPPVMFFLFINTMMVGISEELAFRGVLFRGFLSKMSIVPAIAVTSLMFGGVHVLNAVITGELLQAMAQAVAATLTGVALMAIMIRCGSIVPAIIYHGLWDFFTFMIVAAAGPQVPQDVQAVTLAQLMVPVLLVLPNGLFGLYLLRNVRQMPEFAKNDPTETA